MIEFLALRVVQGKLDIESIPEKLRNEVDLYVKKLTQI